MKKIYGRTCLKAKENFEVLNLKKNEFCQGK
jgi:hypothetical protein